jgi:hypothetical protein
MSLKGVELSQIFTMLEERAQQDRFLTDEEREKTIHIITEFEWGWIYDDRVDIDQFYHTTIGIGDLTDKELLQCCKEYLECHDDIDEDSPSNDIYIANLVARQELEEILSEEK